MVKTRFAITMVFATLVAGCASAPGTSSKASDSRVLTVEEIQHAGYTDAFSAVQSLRPQWLRQRGVTSIRGSTIVKVYLDDSLLGGPDFLRQIAVNSIASMRFIDALEASNRWGLDHGNGAIMVLTRK